MAVLLGSWCGGVPSATACSATAWDLGSVAMLPVGVVARKCCQGIAPRGRPGMRWVRFIHADRDDQPCGCTECRGHPDAGVEPEQVGDDPPNDGTDGISEVAPDPVDAHRPSSP